MRSHSAALLVALLATVAGGCLALRRLTGGAEPLRFDHRAHAGRGADCSACHAAAADAPRAGHPACAPCHTVEDACASCHLEAPAAAAGAAERDLRFSHRTHLLRDIPCERCHGNAGRTTRLEPGAHRPAMEGCVDCHRGLGAAQVACTVCHARTTAATRPPSHDPGWIAHHGDASRERPALCAACHAEADCVRCHQETPPRDHTEFWRRRGHGLESRWDRERCLACHREDTCVDCHRTTPPANHGGAWGQPTYLHCQSCHYPVEDTSCAVCHAAAHPMTLPHAR